MRHRIELTIEQAGGLIYLADSNFGGLVPGKFHEFFTGASGLRELTEKGAVMAATLYQDDGYNVRVVFGELDDQEQDEWTARVSSTLDLSSGRMIISGVCDQDLGNYITDWRVSEDGESHDLGAFIAVPPGVYAVSILSYPPGDLAGGWMAIEDKAMFKACFGRDSGIEHEAPTAYFSRTRPGETPRKWHIDGWEDADFLNFLVQLVPVNGTVPSPRFEADGCLEWEYRKPEKCPYGIELVLAD